jgi:hypothetical protein
MKNQDIIKYLSIFTVMDRVNLWRKQVENSETILQPQIINKQCQAVLQALDFSVMDLQRAL